MVRFSFVPLSDARVTSGPVFEDNIGRWMVRAPIVRAVVENAPTRLAVVQFHYGGPTDTITPANSGRVLYQVGIMLHTADPDNVLTVMWRIAPQAKVFLQAKRHGCYEPALAEVDMPAYGMYGGHELLAESIPEGNGVRIRAWADGVPLIDQPVDPALVVASGEPGVRTDNGRYDLRFFLGER